jgi:hypothetical protein
VIENLKAMLEDTAFILNAACVGSDLDISNAQSVMLQPHFLARRPEICNASATFLSEDARNL